MCEQQELYKFNYLHELCEISKTSETGDTCDTSDTNISLLVTLWHWAE